MPRRTSEESSWVTGRGIGKEVGCVPGCGKTEARGSQGRHGEEAVHDAEAHELIGSGVIMRD